MKIQSLQYEDLSTGWKLDLIEFNPQLTLLVGVSGVGKTKILKAIQNLKKISQSGVSDLIEWNILFVTSKGLQCRWTGKFYLRTISAYSEEIDEDVEYTNDTPEIEYEKVFINNELIIDRNIGSITYKNKETLKFSRDESIIFLLREELTDIHQAFEKIIFNFIESDANDIKKLAMSDKEKKIKLDKYKNLSDIRNHNDSLMNKLYFLYQNDKNSFDSLLDIFIDIFPYVEQLVIELKIAISENDIRYIPRILEKEKGVKDWIPESNISSGMLKTFKQIAELYLCPDNSVILIDEFENSLGINCIDEVVYQMLSSERDLQFIITSHHPYIINKIGYEYWKIVTRKGSSVKCIDAKEFGIGKSKHQAFIQLANLTEYSEGIES